jgi:NAD/NADP transhydrogenase beta subunit
VNNRPRFDHTRMLFGDAKASLNALVAAVKAN